MIEFSYACDKCGDSQTNHTLDSFACTCGGSYRHIDGLSLEPSKFEPHYSPEVKQMVYSWKDAEAKGKAFRSPDHPNGFILTQSNRRFIDDCKRIKRSKEDFIQQTYAQGTMKKDSSGNWHRESGPKYKPGSKVRLDEKSNSFVPVNR